MFKGAKVILRAVERSEQPLLAALFNDLETQLAGGGDPPRPESLAEIEKIFDDGLSKKSANLFLGIEADGKLIGTCGLRDFDETARVCCLGIGIGDKEYRGRGYGRDAINVLLRWAFRYRNMNKVCLDTHSKNERALRCYRACGFVEEGRLRQQIWSDGEYLDEIRMGILREEWLQRQ